MVGSAVVVGGDVSDGASVGPVGVGGGRVSVGVFVAGSGDGVAVQIPAADWVSWAMMIWAAWVSSASATGSVAVAVGSSGSDLQAVNTRRRTAINIIGRRIDLHFIFSILFYEETRKA